MMDFHTDTPWNRAVAMDFLLFAQEVEKQLIVEGVDPLDAKGLMELDHLWEQFAHGDNTMDSARLTALMFIERAELMFNESL